MQIRGSIDKPRKSTVSAVCTADLRPLIRAKKSVLQKAFDSVTHKALIDKLSKLICSYQILLNRKPIRSSEWSRQNLQLARLGVYLHGVPQAILYWISLVRK